MPFPKPFPFPIFIFIFIHNFYRQTKTMITAGGYL